MKVLFYSIKNYERKLLQEANKNRFQLIFKEDVLNLETAFLARGYESISIFTNDNASEDVLKILHSVGVKYITVRSTGFDNIDLAKAKVLGITVSNVPDYSPESIAEHTIMLLLNLLRKNKLLQNNLANQDFSLDNIIGQTIHNKTIGIIGTGKIGSKAAKILSAFGANIIACDTVINKVLEKKYNVKYVSLINLAYQSDIISIHTPLNEYTHYMINHDLMNRMKNNVLIINTARGSIVNTKEIIESLKNKNIGGYATDVYEFEKGIFFYNHSYSRIKDKMLIELMNMDNVIITPHQAFATKEALTRITEITFENLTSWLFRKEIKNEVRDITSKLSILENPIL
jgi:D-lactate dehydrogenase